MIWAKVELQLESSDPVMPSYLYVFVFKRKNVSKIVNNVSSHGEVLG